MARYPRGQRGPPAKGLGRETGAWVRIPPSPPCGCSSVGRTPDCGSGCRGFEFRQSPQKNEVQVLSKNYIVEEMAQSTPNGGHMPGGESAVWGAQFLRF